MDLQNRIGIRVREARKAREQTQEALADLIGKSVDTVSLIERGKILPGLDTLDALSRGLDVRLSDLLGEDRSDDPEVVAMEAAAIQSVRQLSKPVLAVAVQQLIALSALER
jgi:transcriptional regulator with XRE-family HTH domain